MNYDNEEWKEIQDFPNYEASNCGRIRRSPLAKKAPNKTGAAMKPGCNYKGYEILGLAINGTKKSVSVHRMVAKTWIPNPDNLPQVDHINEIKTDNRVENLRWVANDYNIRRSQSQPLKGTNLKTGEEKIFLNSRDAAKYIGGDCRHIQQVYDGNRRHHLNWHFEKIDLDPKDLIDNI